MDTSSANIVPTEDSGGKDRAASVSKVAVETEVGPESRLLPEMLGEELWRTAGAESVEVSKAEFSHALETIGARDNFGLEPRKQTSERQRETFWRALHLEELAIARGCALGRESAWRHFLAQYQDKLTRAAVEMTRSAARKALNYLASKKDANGTWGTTQATIMALRALLTATEKSAADVQGTVMVLVNGKPAEKLELTAENNDLLHQFVFKDLEQPAPSTVELRFEGKGALAYQVVGQYFLPWDEKPGTEALSIDVSYERTRLAQDDLATATATIKNNLSKTAKMVMVDLGIPPGFDLLSEDLQDYQGKSAKMNSGHLSKFSLTATQAILYFDAFAPGDTVKVKFRLRAKYPIRVRTFQSRVYEYYDPEVASAARPVQLEVHR